MISRDKILSFVDSISLLKAIFPEQNWAWFLSRNLHGLTEGLAPIPFDNGAAEIAYQLGDLEDFAVKFGNGKLSVQEIASVIDEHMGVDDVLAQLLDEERDIDSFGGCGEFQIRPKSDDDGNVRLCRDDVLALQSVLQEVCEEQETMKYTLRTLARAISTFAPGSKISGTDVEALSGVARSQAERANAVAVRIDRLFYTFDDCLV